MRKAALTLGIPKREVGDFIGETAMKALELGKASPEKFPAFFSSRAIGWRAHGASRGSAVRIERKALRDIISDAQGEGIDCLGSLPWEANPERVCIALEGLAMIDRLPEKYREALIAYMKGDRELPGVSLALMRKRVQLAREMLGDLLGEDQPS